MAAMSCSTVSSPSWKAYRRRIAVTSLAFGVRATVSVAISISAPETRPTYVSTMPVGCARTTSTEASGRMRHHPDSRPEGRRAVPDPSTSQARDS